MIVSILSSLHLNIREETEFPTCQPYLCAREDPPGNCAKAHGKDRGDMRQPAWLHQEPVLPDQLSGPL